MFQARACRQLDSDMSALTMRPLRLPQANQKFIVNFELEIINIFFDQKNHATTWLYDENISRKITRKTSSPRVKKKSNYHETEFTVRTISLVSCIPVFIICAVIITVITSTAVVISFVFTDINSSSFWLWCLSWFIWKITRSLWAFVFALRCIFTIRVIATITRTVIVTTITVIFLVFRG